MKKAITHLKKADPVLASIIDRTGAYKINYANPDFETMVRSIVSQQLNGRAAETIFTRLHAATKSHPMTPESILKLRPARMRNLGLSGQKLRYIRELARMTRDGDVNFEHVVTLEDDAVVEHLTRVNGIGVWTVHMFLMFAMRRHNVLPTGDYAIRVAMKNAYGLEDLPKPAEMEKIAEPWRPYSSVACWYLWRSLEKSA
jgi:DNA-3-methyladenine glycosylase II